MNSLVAKSALALCGAIALAGCEAMNTKGNPTLDGDVNVIDATELREALRKNPKRIDFERGLAQSLVRARRYDEASPVYKKLVAKPQSTSDDRIAYADALMRSGNLDEAKVELDAVGQNKKAEEYFLEAISIDPNMFSAKNNLVRSRGIRKNYELPIMRMSETEEAQLLHNLGIIATNNGDYDIARGLFEMAVDTHPRHFKEAANNLAALDKVVLN